MGGGMRTYILRGPDYELSGDDRIALRDMSAELVKHMSSADCVVVLPGASERDIALAVKLGIAVCDWREPLLKLGEI
jgi:hypothetical protein